MEATTVKPVHQDAMPVPIGKEEKCTIEEQEVPFCPVCRHHEHEVYAVGLDYELQTCDNIWKFVSCTGCGHVWLNPRPATSALGAIYPSTYYAYNYDTAIHPIARRGKELLDWFKLRGILRHFSSPPGSYVDVGCGDGRFLKIMERRGVSRRHIFGLELDTNSVLKCITEGYQVFRQRVEECEQVPLNAIDFATLFHVIEHVDDPASVVGKLYSWMSPGGILALETPNLDSLDAHWFKDSYWGGYHIPRHWNLFTSATLKRLLTDAGFEVLTTQYQTGHSFWMYSFHHLLRYGRTRWPRLAQWFEPTKGLPFLIGFTALDKLRSFIGFRTSSMLMVSRKPGKNQVC